MFMTKQFRWHCQSGKYYGVHNFPEPQLLIQENKTKQKVIRTIHLPHRM